MAYRETEKMRQRKAEARKRIVECTYQCVAEGGFRSARITRIAGLAGVATGTIYRHFESREDLFAEIFRLATQREVDKVAEALGSPGNAAERLERALRQFAERALKGPQMAWSLIAEPVDPKVEEEGWRIARPTPTCLRKRSAKALKKDASRIRTLSRAVHAWSAPSRKAWLAHCHPHRPARRTAQKKTTMTRWSIPSFAFVCRG